MIIQNQEGTKSKRKEALPPVGQLNKLAERKQKDYLRENRMAAINNEMKRDKSVHEEDKKSSLGNAKHKNYGKVPKQ